MKSPLSLLALVLVAMSSAVHATSEATISAEHRQQIQDLISAYSYTYDGKDVEGYLALYTRMVGLRGPRCCI